MDEIEKIYVPHLRAQFERGRPILFTGAGFSMAAKNMSGNTLPSGAAFKKMLWPICFPSAEYDPDASLQDLYDFAIRRAKGKLSELLTRTFTVTENEFPDWYARVFSLPWQRAYTLNIDDLEQVVSRTATLPRQIRSNSVLKADSGKLYPLSFLEVMHLNGSLDEVPDGVTFSSSQYAQRLASQDPMYRRLSAELLTSPFVFIGSVLEEPTLWQSIEARRLKGGRDQRELRPRSYLVSPILSPAKQALLADFNVVWLQMTAEEFSDQVLSKVGDAAKDGLALLFASANDSSKPKMIPDVASLALNPAEQSEYLLGYQPIWADIQSGRAVERANDEEIWKLAESHWKRDGKKGLIVLSGVSGSGKSTALMRASLRFSASGVPVSWVDPEVELSPKDVRTHAKSQQKPYVVAIEDADLYGSQLSSLIRELVIDDPPALVIAAIRSGRVDRFINPTILGDIHASENTIPLLTDDDIDKLIDVLLRENRPGVLRGMTRDRQRALFREQSGRELLVAMIQATSGKKFSEKAITEMTELPAESARIYGLVAVATSFRFGLTSQDILIALGDETNLSLNSLEMMLRRGLLRRASDGSIFLRHRVIAEVIRDAIQISGSLGSIIQGLALVAASQSTQNQRQSSKPRRILRAILNHDFLQRNVGIETTRNLYASLEEILHWDYHYWLQRGSFEVELGDLSLAENFLNQARGLSQDDPYVETEWAYLLFSQANANATSDGAERLVAEATAILEYQMSRGADRRDAYPFHVMGSQGLAWSRRGIVSKSLRERYLRQLLAHLKNGLEKFKDDKTLERLEEDIKREYLSLAVEDQRGLFSRPPV